MSFGSFLGGKKMKILKFGAIGCSGCLVMKKIWKEIEEEYPNLQIEEYDFDIDIPMREKYQISSIIPVVIFLDEKEEEITRLVGEKTKKEIVEVIEGKGCLK